MRPKTINILISLLIIIALPETGFCNDPNPNTPWPVGFDTAGMGISRTLMHSYGDLNGGWSYSLFHAGIDIHESTGTPPCNEVRCVDNGFATVVDEIPIPGTDGATQWVVIICDGIEGTVQNGWSYGHLTQPSFAGQPNPYVEESQLVGTMTDSIDFPHVHFMWCDWDGNPFSYCNPLDYLDPEPTFEDDYEWTFNPENNNPPFDHFFLPDIFFSDWASLSVAATQDSMLDQSCLSGNVDFVFGVSLRGDGMPGGTGGGNIALAPQKISWDIVRETLTGDQLLETRHIFDFDCVLSTDTVTPDLRAQMLYFRHPMVFLFGHEALSFCLTNSAISEEWDGINTIEENSWNTNCVGIDESDDTINPVLAKYPDGLYRLDVLCFSFDEDYTFLANIEDVELHNFHPALREVFIISQETDDPYYHGEWVPNGLSAVLDVDQYPSAPAGADLEITLVFTEEMNTSSIDAVLGPLEITNGTWSGSVVPNDTWTGEVTLPEAPTDGVYTLLVSASDTDDNDLMDPEGAGTVPAGPYYDCHHALSLAFAAGVEWTRSLHDEVMGSPKLADIDLDGDLDVVVQCADGWVDVLDDDGSSMSGWPVSGGWSSGNPDVWASPAIVNLSGVSSSAPEILAVHPYGCNGFMAAGSAISPWSGIMFIAQRWFASSSPVAGDFDGDGMNEYVMGRQHAHNVWHIITLYARHSNGTSFWFTHWGDEYSTTSTASLCDADGDNDLEVLAIKDYWELGADIDCVLFCLDAANGDTLWNTVIGSGMFFGAIASGNLDSDNASEIIVSEMAGAGSTVKIIDGSSGNIQQTISTNGELWSGASIADIDGDGDNDIVVSSSGGMLYCWGWDGTGYSSLSGFPVNLGTWTDDGVSIGDINGDGMLELVIAGKDGQLHAISHDGTEAVGFPMTISSSNPLSGQPAIGDIDDDGKLEIVFCELNSSVIHCVEMGANSANNYLPWPQFQHDAQNTGYFPTDITPPAPPTDFDGDGEMNDNVLTAELTWVLSVNDPLYTPTPVPPTDVVSYNIYRKIPPRPVELIATLPAGTSEYTDIVTFTSFPYPSAVAYFASAWDGVNESDFTPVIKILTGSLNNVASGCPVREITHSSGVETSQSLTAVGSSLSDARRRSNCRVLTDGAHDEVYFPMSSSDCVEIDLGDVFSITDAVVFSGDISLSASVVDDSSVLMSESSSGRAVYELSVDGRTFSRTDSGNARFIRVYGASGATEIEVYGETSSATSAPVEIRRNESDGYRIASVEGASLTVTVFDLAGRTVWNSTSSSGEVLWNRCSSSGNTVPSGIYLVMVESEDMDTFTAKVVVR